MSRKRFVFKTKVVKISENQQKEIDEIMSTGRFTAEAEVLREGLALLHRKHFPSYLRPTIGQQIKKQKIDQEQEFLSLPDEQFAEENLKDYFIFTDLMERKWLFYRRVGNMIGAIPLDQVKEWVASESPEYNYHRQVAGDGHQPYENFLNDVDYIAVGTRAEFRNLGMALPDEPV